MKKNRVICGDDDYERNALFSRKYKNTECFSFSCFNIAKFLKINQNTINVRKYLLFISFNLN